MESQVSGRGLIAPFLAFAIFCLLPAPAPALDFHARVETRYQLQAGDNALDNDLFQYHFLELSFLKNFTFSWNGGARKDLDGEVNTLVSDNVEKTDIAFRGLADAVNRDQSLEYRIYSAYVKYDTGRFGALLGRYCPVDYEFSQFDGLLLWASPFDWLRLEAFGGKPWHYGYLSNPSYYWAADEVIVGAGADCLLLGQKLQLSLRYLFLRELTRRDALIGETAETYLSNDHLSKLRLSWTPLPWLNAGILASLLGPDPRGLQGWVYGGIEPLLVRYTVNYDMQFIDIADISDRLTQFSSFLGASHPYLHLSVDLSRSFSDLLPLRGFFDDLELELGYEHRQPLSEDARSMFNPQYDQLRVGALASVRGGWSMLLFYNFILSTGLENDLHAVGGELGKKWDKVEVRIGSSYQAHSFETNYTQTLVQDSFFAQEYYLRLKWTISRFFDLSLKGSYENVLLSSLTGIVSDELVYTPLTELFSEPRNYFRFDLRAGYRY
jgi:hypothetical protein